MSTLSLTPLPAPSRAPRRGGSLPNTAAPLAGTDTGVRHFVELHSDALLVFHACRLPRAIRCMEGCVWVTQEGDARDRILHPGQTHALSREGKVAVTALEAARIELLEER